jgi:hypothetical protein
MIAYCRTVGRRVPARRVRNVALRRLGRFLLLRMRSGPISPAIAAITCGLSCERWGWTALAQKAEHPNTTPWRRNVRIAATARVCIWLLGKLGRMQRWCAASRVGVQRQPRDGSVEPMPRRQSAAFTGQSTAKWLAPNTRLRRPIRAGRMSGGNRWCDRIPRKARSTAAFTATVVLSSIGIVARRAPPVGGAHSVEISPLTTGEEQSPVSADAHPSTLPPSVSTNVHRRCR